jgi:hypothetical protein
MPRALRSAIVPVMRFVVVLVLLASLSAAGCGGAASGQPDGEVHQVVPAGVSRPTAPQGPTLVRLERLDGRFGRHDTLIVSSDGRATLQLAHGGGGFRKKACVLDAGSLRGLRHDLARLPIDGPERRVKGYPAHPNTDGVILDRPPVYTVTYRHRFQIFGGATMPADGAPLAARFERILTAHEGSCRTTFQRP